MGSRNRKRVGWPIRRRPDPRRAPRPSRRASPRRRARSPRPLTAHLRRRVQASCPRPLPRRPRFQGGAPHSRARAAKQRPTSHEGHGRAPVVVRRCHRMAAGSSPGSATSAEEALDAISGPRGGWRLAFDMSVSTPSWARGSEPAARQPPPHAANQGRPWSRTPSASSTRGSTSVRARVTALPGSPGQRVSQASRGQQRREVSPEERLPTR
jgi:hypothetical protein